MYILLFSAVTAGLSFNGTLVIAIVGVTITATAILLSIRCVRKRVARRSVPVQVGEVSSTTSFVGPSSSRVLNTCTCCIYMYILELDPTLYNFLCYFGVKELLRFHAQLC